MEPRVVAHLLDINRQFYQTFAGSFSATRRRLQPGVTRILAGMPEGGLVDLGCGNGGLAVVLARRRWVGSYLGLDFSPGLIAEAEEALSRMPERTIQAGFQLFDLSIPEALVGMAAQVQPIHTVLAFAVLHHIPGEAARRRLLEQVHRVMAESSDRDPIFVHSEWQFLNSPRLAARCLPWDRAGLCEGDVDPGDYLLDWRRDGTGLRYVHAFDEAELAGLAKDCGFQIRDNFYSDGENGRLGLYQVWGLQG